MPSARLYDVDPQIAPYELTLHDERGLVVNRRMRSGLMVQAQFDASGRPAFVYQQSGAGTFVEGRSFAFDLAGRRTGGAVFDCSGANCGSFGGYRSVAG